MIVFWIEFLNFYVSLSVVLFQVNLVFNDILICCQPTTES